MTPIDKSVCRKVQGNQEPGWSCLETPGTCESCPEWHAKRTTTKRRKCIHRNLRSDSTCKNCGEFVNLKAKRNKYGAKRDNGFDSRKEARRASELKTKEKLGLIQALDLDKSLLRFSLNVNGVHICDYEADARYVENGQVVIEDVKSKATRTPAYLLKKRLMLACYGVEILEV